MNGFEDHFQPMEEETSCFRTYTVEPGDTLFNIARGFNISLESLIHANPYLTDPNLISPGQDICLPPFTTPREIIYIIKPGDSLFSIARQYNIPLDVLIAVNPQISDPNQLTLGEIIYIPAPLELHSGQATQFQDYIKPGVGGFCQLSSMRTHGYHVAALSTKDLSNSQLCGAYIEVKGPAA